MRRCLTWVLWAQAVGTNQGGLGSAGETTERRSACPPALFADLLARALSRGLAMGGGWFGAYLELRWPFWRGMWSVAVFMYALLGLPAADLLVFGRLGVFVESGGELSQKSLRVMGGVQGRTKGKTGRWRWERLLGLCWVDWTGVSAVHRVAGDRKQWHVVGCMYGSEDTSSRNRNRNRRNQGSRVLVVPLTLTYSCGLCLWYRDRVVSSLNSRLD